MLRAYGGGSTQTCYVQKLKSSADFRTLTYMFSSMCNTMLVWYMLSESLSTTLSAYLSHAGIVSKQQILFSAAADAGKIPIGSPPPEALNTWSRLKLAIFKQYFAISQKPRKTGTCS